MKVIDYNGQIAIASEWVTQVEKPLQTKTVYISFFVTKGRENLLDYTVVVNPDTGVGEISNHPVRGRVIFKLFEWEKINLEQRIKKPRDTANYKWVWKPDPNNPRYVRCKKMTAKGS